jgi:hypothetical protein
MNEEVAYTRITTCTDAVELMNIGKYLYKLYVNEKIKSVIYNWKQRRGGE